MTFQLVRKSEVAKTKHQDVLKFALIAAGSNFDFEKSEWEPVFDVLWRRESKISFKIGEGGKFLSELDIFGSQDLEFDDDETKEILIGSLLTVLTKNVTSKTETLKRLISEERADCFLNSAFFLLTRRSKNDDCFNHLCDRQNEISFNLMIILRSLVDFRFCRQEIGNQISRALGTATFKWMECVRQGLI